MIVMPSNNSRHQVHYWQGKYGGLAHLYSIGGKRGPYEHLPYALDNGRYPCFSNGKKWREDEYFDLLEFAKSSTLKPMWALVPDSVGNPRGTLKEWDKWFPIVREYGFRCAFAVQDGHKVEDVPSEADVVFVGGTTGWKRSNIKNFCSNFDRVHVGRVNTLFWLNYCKECGAESCDGTGWFRGGPERWAPLEKFLIENQKGKNECE